MKKQKGITLIALIITIIVMLILVMITINFAIGEDGIIKNAKNATKQTEQEAILEDIISMAKLNSMGRINVAGTLARVEDKYENKTSGTAEELSITGKMGTYKYKITETEISIWYESREGKDLGEVTGDSQYNGWIILYDYRTRVEAVSPTIMKREEDERGLTLGYDDSMADWEDEDVINEADINKDYILTDAEKSIYSYNHAIETINKYCKTLDLPDNNGVRSIGAKKESKKMYTEIPTTWTTNYNLYNGKVKAEDMEYEQDLEKMQKYGLISNRDSRVFWVASRCVDVFNTSLMLCVRVIGYGELYTAGILNIYSHAYIAPMYDVVQVRPIITVNIPQS